MRKIILASGSKFRRNQLESLHLYFMQQVTDIDETRYQGETAMKLAARLSREKAQAVSDQEALIIGSDQTIDCNGIILGKPFTVEKARSLLREISGQLLTVYSGICVLDRHYDQLYEKVEITKVQLRSFSHLMIDAYLAKEPEAIHCAGGIKSEGLGKILISSMYSNDPHAIIGLPLYFLIDALLALGVKLL